MRELRPIFILLAVIALLLVIVPYAHASHSAGGGTGPDGCGERVDDSVGAMIKGRTDGMVISVDHRVGCKHLVMKNLVGTGRGESYGYSGQEDNCVRYGREQAVNTFALYFDVTVDPSTIEVRCSRYSGPD